MTEKPMTDRTPDVMQDVETVERRCRLDRPEIYKETAQFPLTKLEVMSAFRLAAFVRSILPTLEEIDRLELRHAYETCPDCHSGKGCTKETGCLDLNRQGGTAIQKLIQKALEQA